MSDPVTNLEIEDVLSSIRRLVAEGDKLRVPSSAQTDSAPLELEPAQQLQTEPTQESAPDVSEPAQLREPLAEKFVLTSALRVDDAPKSTVVLWDDEDDVAEVDEPSQGQDEAFGDEEHPAEDDSAAETTESEQASSERAESEWQDHAEDHESTEDQASQTEQHTADPENSSDAAAQEHQPAEAENDAATAQQTDSENDETDNGPNLADVGRESRSRLETTIAELEAAITGQSEEWEPDGSEATPVMDWAATVAEPAFLSSRHTGKSDKIEDAEEVAAKDAPFVLNVAPAPEQQASPATEEDTAPKNPGNLADDLGRSTATALDGELDETLTAYLEEEEILDEETLRNLVVEIVRQELQGALGERITRNVRKLVRREIHRVLSSQDFD